MDVLPAQASAVPCERIFSSAADTDVPDRNKLHPALMEALQIIKFSTKQGRLNFTKDLLAKPADYTLDGAVSSRAIGELTANMFYTELSEILRNIHSLSPEHSVEPYTL